MLKAKRKRCPKCKKVRDIASLFGYRVDKGKVIAQSWCLLCRNGNVITLSTLRTRALDLYKRFFKDSNAETRAIRFLLQRLAPRLQREGFTVTFTTRARGLFDEQERG